MKTISNTSLQNQIREKAYLICNNSHIYQAPVLYFVQIDDEYAVDNTGAIFQIISKNDAQEVKDNSGALQYEGENGRIYNYAEDSADFDPDTEDSEIYNHCCMQAELLADEC